MFQGDALPASEIKEALGEVLGREAQAENSLLDRFVDWILDLLPSFGSGGSTGGVWPYIQDAMILAGLLAALFFVGRLIWIRVLRRAQGSAQEEAVIPVRQRVALLREEAQRARLAGDWKLALRKQFFALVLGLGERGDLEFRDAWTNRELLALGSPARPIHAVLEPLLVELEPKEFGRMPVAVADLDRLEELLDEYFGAADGSSA